MKTAKIAGGAGAETRVVILETGEEAFSALTEAANDAGITAASLTAIGAFKSAVVGWFDFEKKTYKKIEIAQQCEVLSAIGDVAIGHDGTGPADAGGGSDRHACQIETKEAGRSRHRPD